MAPKATTRFIGIREFRENMCRLAEEARKKNIHFVVLRHAIPLFHITPFTKKELDLEELAQEVAEGRAEAARGEGFTQEEMEVEFGLR